MISFDSLSPAQQKALDALVRHGGWVDAYTLQVSRNTLDALVKRELAQRRIKRLGYQFDPRGSTLYRVTQLGKSVGVR